MSKIVTCHSCGESREVLSGREIRQIREDHGMTLSKLGKEVGLSASYISDMEFDRRNCPKKLAKYLLNVAQVE